MFTRYEAKQYAKKFVSDFDDVIVKANMVGSWVRDPKKHAYVSDVDILCITTEKIYYGPPLDLWFATEDQWEAAILYLSIGQYNIRLSMKAKYKGYKFTWRGLYRRGRKEELISTSAAEICEILGVKLPDSTKKILYEGLGRLK